MQILGLLTKEAVDEIGELLYPTFMERMKRELAGVKPTKSTMNIRELGVVTGLSYAKIKAIIEMFKVPVVQTYRSIEVDYQTFESAKLKWLKCGGRIGR